MKVYTNAKIITMDHEKVIPNGAVAVDGNKIAAVLSMEAYKSDLQSYSGAEVTDCGGKVIMPGLVNAHTHITLWRSFGDITITHNVATETMMAVRNCFNCLRKGITTVRDMGHNDFVHNDMKICAEKGIFLAPRFHCAHAIIAMANGHAGHFCVPFSTPYELVDEIHRQVNAGTDFIKLVVSHDDLYHLTSQDLTFPWFSQADLNLAVSTAHELQARVSVHANGVVPVKRSLDAGVDCIEHGIGMTPEQAAQMKAQGTFYVPTLTGYKENGLPHWRRGDKWVERYHLFWERHKQCFGTAVREGVTLVAGTDTLGDLNEEIALMNHFGLTKHEALATATINAAKCMGMESRIGSLEAGKLADFIVLAGNPLEDLKALYKVEAISLDGKYIPTRVIDTMVPACELWASNW